MRLSTLEADVYEEYWGDEEVPVAVVTLKFGDATVKTWRTKIEHTGLMTGLAEHRAQALEQFVADRLRELIDVLHR